MKSTRENIIKFGSLFLVFLLPLLVSSNLAFSFISIKTFFFYGLTELMFVFWIYSLYIDKSYRLNKKQLLFFIPVILYIIWMSMAGILAVNPSLSFWGPIERGTGLLTLYHALAFSFIVASLIKRDGFSYLNKLLKYFLFGSFILTISVWFGNEGFNISNNILEKSSGGGFIGNSSLTAPYLIFSLFFCIYFLFEKQISKNWKIFSFIILITILFSPLFVNIYGFLKNNELLGSARGATLGIIVGAVTLILGYLSLSKNKIIKILGVIGILISIIAFYIGWWQLVKPDTYLHNKFIESASGTRFVFWDIAQKSMDEHPYFGYGPENYMIAFSKNFDIKILDDTHSHEAWSDKAHNIYFDTGVSGGYPSIFLYCIFLLSLFYGVYKAYKNGKISRLQAGALWGLIIGYIFQNLFIFDSPVSIIALFMLSGIIYSLQGDSIKEKFSKINTNSIYRNILVVSLVIFFIASFINFSYLPLKKSREFMRIAELRVDEKSGEYMKLLDGSNAGNDWDASYFAYDTYMQYKGEIKNIQNDPQKLAIAVADLTSYLKHLNKLSETNKTDYRLYLSMLHLYSIKINITQIKFDSNEFEHILSVADYAHKLAPNDPQVYWDVGFLKYFQGDSNGALEEYKKAVNLDKTSKISWVMILNFLKNTGETGLYDNTLKEAQNNIPNFSLN